MRFSLCFCALLMICSLPACGLFKKKPVPVQPKTTLIGVVEMVNPEQNYVLIRSDQKLLLSAGAELIALDATGTEAKLKLTPERKGRYFTADIIQGNPQVANLVIQKKADNTPLNPSSGPVPITSPAPGVPTAPTGPSLTPSVMSLDPLAPVSPVSVPLPTSELPPAIQ